MCHFSTNCGNVSPLLELWTASSVSFSSDLVRASHVPGPLHVSHFAQRTTGKRETARSLLELWHWPKTILVRMTGLKTGLPTGGSV